MTEYILFYKYQIVAGMISAGLLSAAGVMLYLKRMTFFGITLSQAAALSSVLLLTAGIHDPLWIVLFTGLLILPVYFFSGTEYPDAVLAGAFVVLTALTQIVLSYGGAVSNHLVQAFFGDILLIDPQEWLRSLPYLLVISFLYILFYRKIFSVTFDRDQAALSGIRTGFNDLIYVILLSFMTAVSVRTLGSFHSAAFLILPPWAAVSVSSGPQMAVFSAVLLAGAATGSGFLISLLPAGDWHLPTSSVITVTTAVFSVIFFTFGRFFRNRNNS